MATKLTAFLMLALLVLPSCCCLKTDASKEEECDSGCCVALEESLPSPAIPLGGESDPCDCEQIALEVLALPKDAISIAANWKVDFSTDWFEVKDLSCRGDNEVAQSGSLVQLSSFHPPGWRTCQDYCVYRI